MKKLVKSLSYLLATSLVVFLLPTNTDATVTPTYLYEWSSQTGEISADGTAHEFTVYPGKSVELFLHLINRSGTTVKSRSSLPESPGKQVPIGSWGIGSQTPYQDGTPGFLKPSSFVLNNNRLTYYYGPDVPDGGTMTFLMHVKIAENIPNGIYKLYVRPVVEYLAWTRQTKDGKVLPDNNSDIFWQLNVQDKPPEPELLPDKDKTEICSSKGSKDINWAMFSNTYLAGARNVKAGEPTIINYNNQTIEFAADSLPVDATVYYCSAEPKRYDLPIIGQPIALKIEGVDINDKYYYKLTTTSIPLDADEFAYDYVQVNHMKSSGKEFLLYGWSQPKNGVAENYQFYDPAVVTMVYNIEQLNLLVDYLDLSFFN